MKKEKHIKYWINASEVDYRAMNNLFLGHLVIEKLLKAMAVKNEVEIIPKIHDLNKLANKAVLEINDELSDLFDIITSFNIEARYPDYKKEFYKKCTKKFTFQYKEKISELRIWLLEQLNK